jgi:hypothetical protein
MRLAECWQPVASVDDKEDSHFLRRSDDDVTGGAAGTVRDLPPELRARAADESTVCPRKKVKPRS